MTQKVHIWSVCHVYSESLWKPHFCKEHNARNLVHFCALAVSLQTCNVTKRNILYKLLSCVSPRLLRCQFEGKVFTTDCLPRWMETWGKWLVWVWPQLVMFFFLTLTSSKYPGSFAINHFKSQALKCVCVHVCVWVFVYQQSLWKQAVILE